MTKKERIWTAVGLCILCLVVIKVLPTGSPQPEPTALSLETAAWLTDYYDKTPVGGGWHVSSVTAKGEAAIINLSVPKGIEFYDIDFGGIVCPNKLEDVWKKVDDGKSIELKISESGGSKSQKVKC
ncbi:MAG: hypothetical protein OQJ97_18675 [Rhodospirillales bacterium]|nr:hypothetical protein [Rhodospirillales bacterium]